MKMILKVKNICVVFAGGGVPCAQRRERRQPREALRAQATARRQACSLRAHLRLHLHRRRAGHLATGTY